MTHSIYLSGPIAGVNPIIAQQWRTRFTRAMLSLDGPAVDCIDPMRHSSDIALMTRDSDTYITSRDRFDVQRADLVVVNFLYGRADKAVSIGTIMEMAWADAWRKPIIMATPLNNEAELFGHPFIKDVVTTTVYTEEALIKQARVFLSLTDPEPAPNYETQPQPITEPVKLNLISPVKHAAWDSRGIYIGQFAHHSEARAKGARYHASTEVGVFELRTTSMPNRKVAWEFRS